MTIEEIKKKTIGRKLYMYDSFTGTSSMITVSNVEYRGCNAYFPGTDAWGNISGIFVEENLIEQLINDGKTVEPHEVERCRADVEWELI